MWRTSISLIGEGQANSKNGHFPGVAERIDRRASLSPYAENNRFAVELVCTDIQIVEYAPIAQKEEHLIFNQGVGSSILPRRTN